MAATNRTHPEQSPRTRRPPAAVDRVVLAMLRSPLHRLLDAGLCELRYRDAADRPVSLPVLYAATGDRLVVLIGDAPDKLWWRHFRQPAPVEIRRGRQRRSGTGRILTAGDPEWVDAWLAYQGRHQVSREPGDRLLVIDT